MKTPIRILVVDDHFMVRLGLVSVLSLDPDFEVVGQASNGAEAIELFEKLLPDVTLMDGMLPDIHGVEVLHRIIAKHPDARIIIVSINETAEDVHEAMKAGAYGYIPKSGEEADTIRAIHMAADGEFFVPRDLADKLAERNRYNPMSKRELEVLQLVAMGKCNKEIAADLNIGEASIKTYISRIFSKLDAMDRTQAVMLAQQRGLLRKSRTS